MRIPVSIGLAGALLLSASPVYAQRADENAVSQAPDAFGTRIGEENIGLYGEGDVRGFNPQAAGNNRLEGLYFDLQGGITGRLVAGSTIRVGLSSQSYPFPAPSGIVDWSLRIPGEEAVLSAMAGTLPRGGYRFSLDGQAPISETLSIGGGAAIRRDYNMFASPALAWAVGGLMRWKPAPEVEIIPFIGHGITTIDVGDSVIIPGDGVMPAKIDRRKKIAPDWTGARMMGDNMGVIAKATLGEGWDIKTGMFHSRFAFTRSLINLFIVDEVPNEARHFVIGDPSNHYRSNSGEVTLTKTLTTGDLRHNFHVTARGRFVHGLFGGSDVYDAGVVDFADSHDLTEQSFSYTAQTDDKVKQVNAGLAYEGQWRDIAEFGFGIQRAKLTKTVTPPDAAGDRHEDKLWLYNGNVAVHATKALAIYASYARGLEQNDVAPDNATNRGEVLTAIRTSQRDAGLRYALNDKVSLVAGVFDVRRPYYNINQAGLFTSLGTVKHRGVEISLSGQAAPGLFVVAGAVLMNPTVTVDNGIAEPVGERPVGQQKVNLQGSVDYALPFAKNWSVDASATWSGRQTVNTANTLWTDPRFGLDLGARYKFKIGKTPASLRVRWENVTNDYGWFVTKGGALFATDPRQFSFYVTADI